MQVCLDRRRTGRSLAGHLVPSHGSGWTTIAVDARHGGNLQPALCSSQPMASSAGKASPDERSFRLEEESWLLC